MQSHLSFIASARPIALPPRKEVVMHKKPGGLDRRRRGPLLATICLAALALPLSFSGGAVATPALGRELSGSSAALGWVMNAFMLSFGCLLLAAGALADRYGRRRVFMLGVAGFSLSSLALAAAPSLLAVDLLRASQGAFAAAALAAGTGALAQEFDTANGAWAFSLLGTTFGIGLAIGPLLAGWLIAHTGWRACFLSSALASGLAWLLGHFTLRESRAPATAPFDWVGAASFSAALCCLTFAIIEAPGRAWTHPVVVGPLAAALALGQCFVAIERRSTAPLFDLSLLRIPRFVGVQLLPLATCFCYVVLLVALPLRMLGVEGLGAGRTGLLMLALSLPMVLLPLPAAALARRLPVTTLCSAGLMLAGLSLLWLAHAVRNGMDTSAIAPLLGIGIGAALPWGLMDGLSVSVVAKEQAGMAAGIFSTMRVAGEGIALAVVNAALAGLTQAQLASLLGGVGGLAGQAAARLAIGDLPHASALLPAVPQAALLAAYRDAFGTLLTGLAVLSFLCALAIWRCLGRPATASHPRAKPAVARS
jgi:MFS family permease